MCVLCVCGRGLHVVACNVGIRDNIAELILSYLWVPGLKLRSSALVTDILAR